MTSKSMQGPIGMAAHHTAKIEWPIKTAQPRGLCYPELPGSLSGHPLLKARVTKDPSKIKRCPECRRLVEASTMRPLSRTRLGGGVRFACPDCFKRVMDMRKAVAGRR
jgi:hypothetical protein